MSDIKARHGLPRTPSLPAFRAGSDEAEADQGARLGGRRRRRRPRGRGRRPNARTSARVTSSSRLRPPRRPRQRRRHAVVRGRPRRGARARRWTALVLPKATPEAVDRARRRGPAGDRDRRDGRRGLRLAYETASHPARGGARCSAPPTSGAELGLEPRPDGLEMLYARSKVVVDSAAAGIRGAVRRRPPRHPGRRGARGGRAASRGRSASAARPASTRRRCRS